jgi:hypothetical protein
VTPVCFQQEQQLFVRHSPTERFLMLDALQLAVALGRYAITPLDDFIRADANLCLIAAAAPLTVIKLEVP